MDKATFICFIGLVIILFMITYRLEKAEQKIRDMEVDIVRLQK
jgi:hypothetical protein